MKETANQSLMKILAKVDEYTDFLAEKCELHFMSIVTILSGLGLLIILMK